MTSAKNLAALKRFQSEISRSQKWREGAKYDDLWKRMINMYAGKQYDAESGEDRMVINRAFSTKNVIAPSVAVNNPKFIVQSRRPETGGQAMITEQVLNYMWRTHRYQGEFRSAVDDALIVGFGWLKVGYKFKTQTVKKIVPADRGTVDPNGEPGVADREPVEGNVESEVKVFDDRPFVERISVFDIYVDPDARNMGEARWIAQRVRRPLVDIKVDERYKQAHRVKAAQAASDAHTERDEDSDASGMGNDASAGYGDVWEFYDLRTEECATFLLDYSDGFLIEPAKCPYTFGHPFEMVRNYDVPDRFYPMGELEAIEVLQGELNKTRTEQMLHRRGAQRKYLVAEEALGDNTMNELQSDKDGQVVKINTAAVDLDKAVIAMPTHAINADAYNMSDVITRDIDDTTGVQDFGQSAIRRTATEAAMIQDQQNARASDKLAKIEGTLARVGEKLIQLLQQYMRGSQTVRIVGSESAPLWLTYDRDYIAGVFDFEVEAGSTQPRNESFRAQRAMQLMDAMAPFLQMGVADPVAVMRKVLQDGFGVKDPTPFMSNGGELPPEPGGQAPPQGAGPMPAAGAPMGMAPQAEEQSGIEGIPPELLSRLDIEPSPANAAAQMMP